MNEYDSQKKTSWCFWIMKEHNKHFFLANNSVTSCLSSYFITYLFKKASLVYAKTHGIEGGSLSSNPLAMRALITLHLGTRSSPCCIQVAEETKPQPLVANSSVSQQTQSWFVLNFNTSLWTQEYKNIYRCSQKYATAYREIKFKWSWFVQEKQDWNHYLSERRTKCWLSGSSRALTSNLFSASTIDTLPQVTSSLHAYESSKSTYIINIHKYKIQLHKIFQQV